MRHNRMLVAIALGLLAVASACGQRRIALLAGVDQYSLAKGQQPPRVKVADQQGRFESLELDTWVDLQGSVNDVSALQDLLIARFQFAPPDVHLLLNHDATDAALLAAMHRYLVDEARPGDEVLFYWAGHGSMRRNTLGDKDGQMENTIVGADANTGAFDVRDKQIRALLNIAADKGVRVTAIFDSCHSGTIARGIPQGERAQPRLLGYDPRDLHEPPPSDVAPEDRAKNPALVVTAASMDQVAWEYHAPDGTTHGAFTYALLQSLRELPPDSPAGAVFEQIAVTMQSFGLPAEQSPFLSQNARARQPIFATPTRAGIVSRARSSGSGVRIAVTAVHGEQILINSGTLENIGVGSMLRGVAVDGRAQHRLVVTTVPGAAQSVAKLADRVSATDTVRPGDLFTLESWKPAQTDSLQLWIPPAMSETELAAATPQIAQLRASAAIHWVADPALEAAEFQLAWDGAAWKLRSASRGETVFTWLVLVAAQVVDRLPHGASLLVAVPPSESMTRDLAPQADDLYTIAKTPAQAQYVLLQTAVQEPTQDHMQAAWVRRDVLERGMTVQHASGQDAAMCSAGSGYPVRSDWAAEPTALRRKLQALARLYAWLHLQTPPASADSFPYHLQIVDYKTKAPMADAAGRVPVGVPLQIAMEADHELSLDNLPDPRKLYIVGIGCGGDAQLLYGADAVHTFPPDADTESTVLLNAGFTLERADESQTLVLLATSDALTDLSVFDFDAVSTAQGRGDRSPLERLLSSATVGKRGEPDPVPTDWTVQYLRILPTAEAKPSRH